MVNTKHKDDDDADDDYDHGDDDANDPTNLFSGSLPRTGAR